MYKTSQGIVFRAPTHDLFRNVIFLFKIEQLFIITTNKFFFKDVVSFLRVIISWIVNHKINLTDLYVIPNLILVSLSPIDFHELHFSWLNAKFWILKECWGWEKWNVLKYVAYFLSINHNHNSYYVFEAPSRLRFYISIDYLQLTMLMSENKQWNQFLTSILRQNKVEA